MKKQRVKDSIIIIALFLAIVVTYQFYKKNDLNDFSKAEQNRYTSQFSRDHEAADSKQRSYKIESAEWNDAMLVKEIKVTPNYLYKVSCKVKTQEVKKERENSDAGAHLSISASSEKSKSIVGTEDWQEIHLYFDAKNRNTVQLGFRLGGNDGNCIGTAWFSDLTIEEVEREEDTNWSFACFIIENVNVMVNEKQISLHMSLADISNMKQNMARFQKSCQELSNYNMTVEYEVITIQEPLTTLSYDEENGYYVSPGDVKQLMDPYLAQKEYDHIFLCVRLGDISHQNDIEIKDWIGLRRNGLFRHRLF